MYEDRPKVIISFGKTETDRQIHVRLSVQSLRMVGKNTVCYHILEDDLVIKTFYRTGNTFMN